MRKLDTSYISSTRGMPIKSGTLNHLQTAYQEAIAAAVQGLIGQGYSSSVPYILIGCINSGSGSTYNISAGAVFFNGEVYITPAASFTVSGSNVAVGVLTTGFDNTPADNADPVEFTDGSVYNVHQIRTVVFQAGLSGSGAFNFSSLVAINTNIPQLALTGSGLAVVSGTYPNINVAVSSPNKILRTSSYSIGDPGTSGTVISSGVASAYTVSFADVGTAIYTIAGELVSNSTTTAGQISDASNSFVVVAGSKTSNSFQIIVKKKDGSAGTANLNFEFILSASV